MSEEIISTSKKHVYVAKRNSELWHLVRNDIASLDILSYSFDKYEILQRIFNVIEESHYYDLLPEDYIELFQILQGSENFQETVDKTWSILLKDRIHPYHESVSQIMTLVSEMLFIFHDNQDSFPWDMIIVSRAAAMCSIMVKNSHFNISYDQNLYHSKSTIGLWRSIGRYHMERNGSTLQQKRDISLIFDIAYGQMKRLMDNTPDGKTKDRHMEGYILLRDSTLQRLDNDLFESNI